MCTSLPGKEHCTTCKPARALQGDLLPARKSATAMIPTDGSRASRTPPAGPCTTCRLAPPRPTAAAAPSSMCRRSPREGCRAASSGLCGVGGNEGGDTGSGEGSKGWGGGASPARARIEGPAGVGAEGSIWFSFPQVCRDIRTWVKRKKSSSPRRRTISTPPPPRRQAGSPLQTQWPPMAPNRAGVPPPALSSVSFCPVQRKFLHTGSVGGSELLQSRPAVVICSALCEPRWSIQVDLALALVLVKVRSWLDLWVGCGVGASKGGATKGRREQLRCRVLCGQGEEE
jgi:hypothetical protein